MFFADRAPCVGVRSCLFKGPVKPNRNACDQRFRNVLADERLVLPTVDGAIDFLRAAHRTLRLKLRKKAAVTAQLKSRTDANHPVNSAP